MVAGGGSFGGVFVDQGGNPFEYTCIFLALTQLYSQSVMDRR